MTQYNAFNNNVVNIGPNLADTNKKLQPSKHTSIGPMLALYWRVPFVPATVQTVLSQYTGHTMIKVDVLARIGPALARLYRPSIGPLVSAQHWPDCIGPALARLYRPSIGPIPANFNIVPQDVAAEVFHGAT